MYFKYISISYFHYDKKQKTKGEIGENPIICLLSSLSAMLGKNLTSYFTRINDSCQNDAERYYNTIVFL